VNIRLAHDRAGLASSVLTDGQICRLDQCTFPQKAMRDLAGGCARHVVVCQENDRLPKDGAAARDR
jgi:hypothetical protein